MPTFRAICLDITSCMCSHSGKMTQTELFRRREDTEMPARQPLRPVRQVNPLRSPDPRWIHERQAQAHAEGRSTNRSGGGPPTVLLVPKRQQSRLGLQALDSSPLQAMDQSRSGENVIRWPGSCETSLTDEMPPTPTPHARQRPGSQPRRVNSQKYERKNPRVALPISRALPEGFGRPQSLKKLCGDDGQGSYPAMGLGSGL